MSVTTELNRNSHSQPGVLYLRQGLFSFSSGQYDEGYRVDRQQSIVADRTSAPRRGSVWGRVTCRPAALP